ncbi:hypothetical protein GIB67_035983 [Kingdonia uniflora]|uniref:RRM domain-containing protein n=1 Tax=Kingdonia uniflora TaxID=39325 RepID=A0A7J7N198_9MAGN|nr:hypothetical protein GIB67_035983 [Kingdonia uniflora]
MASRLGRVEPSNGSIYVCNLPHGTDEDMLAEFFGTIGLLKKDKRTGQPKIWFYRDKVTNEPKGDATVTYEDPHAALAAVEWFNNKDFHGNTIGVFIAESKNKEDHSYNLGSYNVGDQITQVRDPSVPDDSGEQEVSGAINGGGGGRGGGRGDASGKAWQQDGDWMCPNTRSVILRALNGRIRADHIRIRIGLGRCANINWAKRTKCNICNTNKPGHNEGGVRGGRAGGYKELDEEEIEETRRRRREAEEDDGEMYDEFGNLKKKFRAKTQQAEAVQTLPGAGRAGWEVDDLERNGRERSKDGRDRYDREKTRSRDRDDYAYEREKRRSRSRERDRDRGDRGRDRDGDRVRDDRGREHGRDRDRRRDW